MKIQPKKTERIHAMDSLRAIMMLLGIVLHTTITYIGGEPNSGWPLRDPNTFSQFQEWLLDYIHVFRMPIFMVVAGFFAALLFYERSPRKMLINRIKRILYPFIVAILILWPLTTLAFSYSNNVFSWDRTFDSPIGTMFVGTTLNTFKYLNAFIPERTMHLWFLYYLMIFSLVSYLLGLLFRKLPCFTSRITIIFNKIIQKPYLKLLFFTTLTYCLFQIIDKKISFSFIPSLDTFFFYFYFYVFGWILFKSKELLPTFMNFDWLFLVLGTVIYTSYYLIDLEYHPAIRTLINSTCLWMFIFGIIGLFLRYASNHSARMRYISDASYWVYLLHLPLTALIPGLIGNLKLPAIVKFLIVVVVATVICFATYHYLVRGTFIGKFLNGRKYSRKRLFLFTNSSKNSFWGLDIKKIKY
jgi:glucan biosynthesis protein C